MSGRASTGIDRNAEAEDQGKLSEDEVETIREAEQERRMDPSDRNVPKELSLDMKFELLKNQRRRRVLRFLMANGDASTTGELAEHVAALENDKADVDSLTSKERKAAYVGLYQCHLPKMDDYGVIEFNQARGQVELTDVADQLEEFLVEETDTRWSLRYLGIAVAGGGLFLASLVAGVEGLTIAVVFATIAGIVLTSVGHRRVEQER